MLHSKRLTLHRCLQHASSRRRRGRGDSCRRPCKSQHITSKGTSPLSLPQGACPRRRAVLWEVAPRARVGARGKIRGLLHESGCCEAGLSASRSRTHIATYKHPTRGVCLCLSRCYAVLATCVRERCARKPVPTLIARARCLPRCTRSYRD